MGKVAANTELQFWLCCFPLDKLVVQHHYFGMPKVREKKVLESSLEKRLVAYTVAATSGLVALTAPAQGAIVYTSAKDFGEAQPKYSPDTIFIDLNHDLVNDFELLGSGYGVLESSFFQDSAFVYAFALNGNAVALQSAPGSEPPRRRSVTPGATAPKADAFCCGVPPVVALNFGEEVGPNLIFGADGYLGGQETGLNSSDSFGFGPFYNEKNKFIGLKFLRSGKTYYGWARVSTQAKGRDLYFELVDYAYQNTPGLPILAGQGIPKSATARLDAEPSQFASPALTGPPDESPRLPATLGLLAYGTDALSAWRGK